MRNNISLPASTSPSLDEEAKKETKDLSSFRDYDKQFNKIKHWVRTIIIAVLVVVFVAIPAAMVIAWATHILGPKNILWLEAAQFSKLEVVLLEIRSLSIGAIIGSVSVSIIHKFFLNGK